MYEANTVSASISLNATVAHRVEVSPGLIILNVIPDKWEIGEFSPGQFAVLGLPGSASRYALCDGEDSAPSPNRLIKRAYSIASSSVDREYLEFYISLVSSGALTPRLFALSRGDRLWVDTVMHGLFTLDEVPDDKHVVLISTGTGLAPYMSMLRTQLVCGGKRHFAVLHGARHSWDLGYRSELMTLDGMCPNFSYIPTVSRLEDEAGLWKGRIGYVQDLWMSQPLKSAWGFHPGPEDTDIFVCGNPSMVESIVPALEAEGFVEHKKNRRGQIHVERYW
ncbi:MAG: ferredoxin--NADP reductase [Planctomycetota bacterium]|nr:ferredoxin--NADP reductase [Planctomycetota bacterium]